MSWIISYILAGGRQRRASGHIDGVITLSPDELDLTRGFRLALELRHPVQDCLYLALAERLGAELFTADEKFVARAAPSHPAVRALA